MNVSIILVNYNTRELTKNCLNSIYANTYGLDFDVWVVDNASKDGSVEMLKFDFPQINLIESSKNLGFGRANNIAINKSNAKYCFLLNTDTVLANNAVKILFDFMEKSENEKVGACGGNLYSENGKPASSFGRLPDRETLLIRHTALKLFLPKRNKFIKNYENNIDRSKTQEISYISGADLMIKKSVLEQVGNFDEKFFLYYEETELQYRIKKAGYEIWFVPESKIIHLEGQSAPNLNKTFIINRSRGLYYKLCYGSFWGILIKILFFPSYIKTFIKTSLKSKSHKAN